jgi:hypothetical protein
MFKDRNEVRKAGQILYPWLEQLIGVENNKLAFNTQSTQTIDRIKEYNKRF